MNSHKTAHFTITGAAFTKAVRSRMLDDAPGAAFQLASCLMNQDDPVAQLTVPALAMKLCDGTAKVRGNESDMTVVDDDTIAAKRYRERLRWLYAGRIRIGTTWYRPTAYVTDVGPHDVRSNPREKHYCGPDEIVSQATVPDPEFKALSRTVIFEQCGERPHWHKTLHRHQEALQEYLDAGHTLQERSHSKYYQDDPPPVQRKPRKPAPPGRGPNKYRGTINLDTGRSVDEAEDDAAYAAEEASRLRYIADLRELILKQAGDDLLEFAWPDKFSEHTNPPELLVAAGKAMIPRAPFLIWAFTRLAWLKMKMPTWKTVSPSGMKMQMDDAHHTDWIIGGGFDPRNREFYWGGVYAKAAEELRGRLQDEHDDRQRAEEEAVTTLITGPTVQGYVHYGRLNKPAPAGSVVVLPNLSPKYLVTVSVAAAVITEEGGEVAHLAQIGRERGLPMVRRPDALAMFNEHDLVEVNTEARTVRVLKRHVNDPTEVEDDDDAL